MGICCPAVRLYDTTTEAFARSRLGAWMFLHVFTPIDRFLLTKTKGRVGTAIGTRFLKDNVMLSCRRAVWPQTRGAAAEYLRGGGVRVSRVSGRRNRKPSLVPQLESQSRLHADGPRSAA